MSKKNGSADQGAQVTEAPAQATRNVVLTYRRDHPGNRCSYGVAGNAGIVVFDKGLFAGSDAADFQPPATITLDCELVAVKADAKVDREAAKAAKLAERAAKAEARVEESKRKAEEKAAKAREAAEKAQAKLAAAQQKQDAPAQA